MARLESMDVPKQGEIWEDKDPRRKGRLLFVDKVDSWYAHCKTVHFTERGMFYTNPRTYRIKRSRFQASSRGSGYRFVNDWQQCLLDIRKTIGMG